MADSNVPVAGATSTALIDTEVENVGGQDVQRQRVILVPGRDPRGCADYHAVAGSGTNEANVKASPGQVYGWRIFNNAGYPIYVKLHNSSGTPTPGSGVVQTIGVQAGMTEKDFNPLGAAFTTGIGISIVKGLADADATGVLADDCVVDLLYA